MVLRQVVPDAALILEELRRHASTHGVRAAILNAGRAVVVAIEACLRAYFTRTLLERRPEDVLWV